MGDTLFDIGRAKARAAITFTEQARANGRRRCSARNDAQRFGTRHEIQSGRRAGTLPVKAAVTQSARLPNRTALPERPGP